VNVDDLGAVLDGLLEPVDEDQQGKQAEPKQPKAEWQSGFSWRGDDGEVTTDPIAGENQPEWASVLRIFEVDPDEYEIVEPVLFNAWHGPSPDGPVLYRQWKAKVVRRRSSRIDVDDLVSEIRNHKALKKLPDGESAFVVMLSDWQVGKSDGDGTKGTVNRILDAIDDVERRVRELRKMGRSLGTMYVLWTGDSVEGCLGHYDQQTFTVELDRRSQVKVTRRLLRDALKTWSRLFSRVVVVAVAGNHGENRNSSSKSYTTFGDNDDLAIVEGVAEAFSENPDRYGHVEFIIPRENLSVTVDVCGWIVGVTHGHAARGSGAPSAKLKRWYEQQAAGKQPVGASDLLCTGHYHHLAIADWGGCVWVQAPALDGGSDWWRYRAGEVSEAGVLTWVTTPTDRLQDVQMLSYGRPDQPK